MYKCEIPGCDREVAIRTKIKNRDSEYYGKSACPYCASQHNIQKPKEAYYIKPFTDKAREARKEERKDYSGFFQKHIQEIKDGQFCCEECGDRLFGEVSEVAHIFSKRFNPEIATEDENIMYLCGRFSTNRCHALFDKSLTDRKSMKCFEISKEKVQDLESKIIKKTKEYILYYD